MEFTVALFILGAMFACDVLGAANHDHESTETDTMHFYYDPTMHYFTAATSGTCYIVPLTFAEQDHVHTTQGIEDIELTMMRQWLGILPEVKVYHNDANLPENVRRACHNKDIFLLQRNITETTTPVSPLASLGN